MKAKTIRVLVYRTRGGFVANTGEHEGHHVNSSTLAARQAAAKALEVSEAKVELTPIGPDILEASIKHPTAAISWDLLFAGIAAAAVVAGAWWVTMGGAL
jgi:hypothetical protein